MKRAVLSSCSLVLLLPVLFLGAALGVLGGGAGVSLGQGTPEQVAGIPPEYLQLFQTAGAKYGVPWEVLAGIGKVECDDGQDPDPSCTKEGAVNYAGAGGPMQFLVSTWAQYGVNASGGNAPPDRWNAADAIFTAARYLKANGAPQEIRRAIFAYNHSQEYVEEVLRWASTYEHEAALIAPQASGAAGTTVSFALSQLGVPYVWGGESSSGYDCSGLVQASYRAAGISLPRTAQEQWDAGPHLPAGAQLEPGDLVFFGASTSEVSHVGIVVRSGEMVDAPHTGTVVRTEPFPTTVGAAWGEDRYLGATRPAAKRLFAGQPHLAWEISASETGTVFRLWVPSVIPASLIERAVTAAWPGASTTIEPADEPDADGMVASELVIAGRDWFALDSSVDPDPLRVILGQLSGMEGGQRAVVQVLARPATGRERGRLRAAARRMRAGVPTSRAARVLEVLSPRPPSRPTTTLDPTIPPDVRDVLDKSAQPLYRCLVRVAVCGPSRAAAAGRLNAVVGGFAPYEGRVGLRRRGVRRAQAKLSYRWLGRRAFTVSTPELAALAHLPADVAIPGLVRASAREISSPPGLAGGEKSLGVSANGRKVGLAVVDARQHIHVLGPTGVGKSTLLAQLALADFRERRGAIVIDPKGDLVDDILARIPAGEEHRVDLLDPSEAAPLTLNLLDNPDRDLGVDQLVSIFRRVFERDWGPRTDDIFRSTLLTLTATVPTATLTDVPRLLSDADWRAQLIAQIDDPIGLGPFWDWYQGLSESQRAQNIGPLQNKLRAFLLRRPVRAIVGHTKTTLDIPRCLDQGRLLLARLPKGTLGEDTSRLLGSMIVARAWQAALARAVLKPEQRRDCALLVDEVHNYLNLPTPIPDVLAEARGYRLSFCLAHQHLAQLTPEVRAGIDANARTKVYFQLSQEDAHHLEPEVRPELSEYDLANLPLYTAAVRLCHNGQPSRPFTLTTENLPAAEDGRGEAVRALLTRRAACEHEQADEAAVQQHSTKPLQRRPRHTHNTPTGG